MRLKLIALSLFLSLPSAAARRLTLDEALDLAKKQNPALKIARLRVEENDRRRLAARSDYFPQVRNESYYNYVGRQQVLEIPRGALGDYPSAGPIPGLPVPIPLGGHNLFLSATGVGQPLTQWIKVREGVRAAEADKGVAMAQSAQGEREIAFAVEQVYYGLLIAQQQRLAAEAKVAAADEALKDSQSAVVSGNTLAVSEMGRKAQRLEAMQARLKLEMQISDLMETLNDLIGLPLATELELVAPAAAAEVALGEENPEVREAEQMVAKARHGVRAARADWIPEVTALAQHIYQNGVPLLASNNALLGAKMSWQLFDYSKRRETVKEREAQLAQAEENLRRVKSKVELESGKAARKVAQSRQLVAVAQAAAEARVEAARLSADQLEVGIGLKAQAEEAKAAAEQAKADAFAAELGLRLAQAELRKITGR